MTEQSKIPERDAYSVDEFCHRIGISRPTFYRLRNEGKVRAIKLGGRTLVPVSETDRILRGEVA